MKQAPFSIDQLSTMKKPVPPKKMHMPKRKHWSEDFFKHLDAWGHELRKAARKADA